jgi:hypothetical protein
MVNLDLASEKINCIMNEYDISNLGSDSDMIHSAMLELVRWMNQQFLEDEE